MADESFDDFDEVIQDAGERLVASLVLLVAGIFSFIMSAVIIRMISDLGRLPVDGNTVLLSAAIMAAAIIVSSVHMRD